MSWKSFEQRLLAFPLSSVLVMHLVSGFTKIICKCLPTVALWVDLWFKCCLMCREERKVSNKEDFYLRREKRNRRKTHRSGSVLCETPLVLIMCYTPLIYFIMGSLVSHPPAELSTELALYQSGASACWGETSGVSVDCGDMALTWSDPRCRPLLRPPTGRSNNLALCCS